MRTVLLLATLVLAWLGTARAQPQPDARDEDLFKWGEYDSLIRVLEPEIRGAEMGRNRADTMARAKSYLFLGVAFFATGKRERADEAFLRAVELDPQVRLDRFYVTQEIANHFQAIALHAFHHRATSLTAPAGAGTAVGPAPKPAASRPTAPEISPAPDRKWLWVGLGITVAAAAAGGGYYLLAADRPGGETERTTSIDATGQ